MIVFVGTDAPDYSWLCPWASEVTFPSAVQASYLSSSNVNMKMKQVPYSSLPIFAADQKGIYMSTRFRFRM